MRLMQFKLFDNEDILLNLDCIVSLQSDKCNSGRSIIHTANNEQMIVAETIQSIKHRMIYGIDTMPVRS